MHTNGADDAGTAEVLGRGVLGVEVGQPFHPRTAILLVGERVGHCDLLSLLVLLLTLLCVCWRWLGVRVRTLSAGGGYKCASARTPPQSFQLSSTPYPVRLGFHTLLRNWLVMEGVTALLSIAIAKGTGEQMLFIRDPGVFWLAVKKVYSSSLTCLLRAAPAPPTSTKPAALGCDTIAVSISNSPSTTVFRLPTCPWLLYLHGMRRKLRWERVSLLTVSDPVRGADLSLSPINNDHFRMYIAVASQ